MKKGEDKDKRAREEEEEEERVVFCSLFAPCPFYVHFFFIIISGWDVIIEV